MAYERGGWAAVMLLAGFALARPSVAKARTLGLNDLSVLVPLPTSSGEASRLLRPSGSLGTFFPARFLTRQPRLLPDATNDQLYREQLAVVAMRIDPCFREGTGEAPCRHEIRLVWQPVRETAPDAGGWRAEDAALHTFYDFDEDEWPGVFSEWSRLPSRADVMLPLQVNPTLRGEGLGGPYWGALRELLARRCDEDHLTRITGTGVNQPSNAWVFAGFDVVDGGLRPIAIPRVGKTVQAFLASSAPAPDFLGGPRPEPAGEPDFNAFLANSAGFALDHGEAELRPALKRAYAFENPRLANPGTIDCVSCHVAQSVRAWGERRFPAWHGQNVFPEVSFVSRWNLENRSTNPAIPSRVRAFGYSGNEAVISPRVVNETAAVAESLE